MRRLSLVSFVLFVLSAHAADFSPAKLTVEHMINPAVIDTDAPRFSWINEPTDSLVRNARQKAYRIAVASSDEGLNAGVFDVWDTGKVLSDDSYLVSFKGDPLKEGSTYFWKVQTWDDAGKTSGWSDIAQFGTGLKDTSWHDACWIGAPWRGEKPRKYVEAQENIDFSAPLFRKEFNVSKNIKSAKVFITALGYFELHLNGQKVGDDVLVPNFTNYTQRDDFEKYWIVIDNDFSDYRVMYSAYDIKDLINTGNNAIGVILGTGFSDATYAGLSPYGSPRFLCRMVIDYGDGTTETISSGTDWKSFKSPILCDGPFDGEIYDATHECRGWDGPGYDDSLWQYAVERKAPIGKLCAHLAPTDKVVERFAPISIEKMADGSFDVCFPAEISGWIRMHNLAVTPNDIIEIKYYSDQQQGVHRYIAADSTHIDYAPRFTWYVFSKANIAGVDNLTAENIVAEAVNTYLQPVSTFSSSYPILDNIHTIWRRSLEDNLHGGIASDCPHRERAPYTGDGQVSMNTVLANYDAAAFYRKWLRDMRDAQNPHTGYVPNSAPWQPGCGGGVPWGAAMNTMPWEYYLHYGDRDVLAENYDAMKAQVGYMLGWLTEDGTMYAQRRNTNKPEEAPNYWLNLGDWCAPADLPSEELVHTFYLWRCLDYTAKAAKALGHIDDEVDLSRKAKQVANAFHNKFYDSENKSYGDFGANVFALEMGVPDSIAADVANTLAHEIGVKYNNHLNTGIFGSRYLFEQLAKNGYNDIAFKAMTATDFPGFGNWLAQGATTTWEQWDGQNSRNHHMFGGALSWLYNTLAGVTPQETAPGYRAVTIRPVPWGEDGSVKYSLETPFGTLKSEVTYTDDKTSLDVTIPVGSVANIYIPLAKPFAKINADKSKKMPKGRYTSDGKYFLAQIPQGSYKFMSHK